MTRRFVALKSRVVSKSLLAWPSDVYFHDFEVFSRISKKTPK
jgi:hypothetical protein